MPTFRITSPNGTFQITAPDHDSAYSAFAQYQAGIPAGGASTGADTGAAMAAPVPGFTPGQAPTPDQLAALQANWGKTDSGVAPPEVAAPQDVMPAPLRAFSTHAVEGVPLLGAALQRNRMATQTVGQGMAQQSADIQAPAAAIAGDVFGGVTPYLAAGAIPGVAGVMGADAGAIPSVLGRGLLAGGSQATITGADSLLRGDSPADAAVKAGTAGTIGMLAPGVGAAVVGDKAVPLAARIAVPSVAGAGIGSILAMANGATPGQVLGAGVAGAAAGASVPALSAAARWAGGGVANAVGGAFNHVAGMVQGATDPDAAAAAAFNRAAVGDIKSGQPILTPADEAAAAANGQPLMNVDRLGKNTMALARASSDLSPDANAIMDNALTARTQASNTRTTGFLQNLFGNTDSQQAQQGLQAAARQFATPAWKAAYNDPKAASIMTPGIDNLMQYQAFRAAIPAGVKEANADAYLGKMGPVANPFRMTANGGYQPVTGSPDGPARTPSLQFWAGVSRALGKQAQDEGTGTATGASLEQMRQNLNSELDSVVPAYQTARQGSATFFNAQDALEAGKNFVGMPESELPGAQDALDKMSPPERKLFQMGFGSNLIDKVSKATANQPGVTNQIFGSPVAKQQIQMVLGPQKAAQTEAYLRLQNIMQMRDNYVLKGSNTAAKQAGMQALTGGGIGYGAGVASSGGQIDPRRWNPVNWGAAATMGAIGRQGYKYMGQQVDTAVLPRIAELMTSKDPSAVQQAVSLASKSPRSMGAIKAIEHGMQMVAPSLGADAAGNAIQPQAPADVGPEGYPKAYMSLPAPGQ